MLVLARVCGMGALLVGYFRDEGLSVDFIHQEILLSVPTTVPGFFP